MTSSTAPRPADLSAALPRLPLFPLPHTVLFPGALLPLHIFEPRYREMVRDALTSHRLLAVVLITDPATVDAHGNPVLASVGGVGELVEHAELSGGRYNILLRGRARVRLTELPFEPPYRTASATVMEEQGGEVSRASFSALLSTATAFASLVRDRDRSFDFRLPRDASPGLTADLCAHYLVLDPRERQIILETRDAPTRVQRVTDALALQRLSLSSDAKTLN